MDFKIINSPIGNQRSACLVVGVHESMKLTASAKHLNKSSRNYISKILKKGDIKGKAGETLLLHTIPNGAAERVLLVGCGKEIELNDQQFRRIITAATKTLDKIGVKECVSYLGELKVTSRSLPWKIRQMVEAICDTLYRFEQMKSSANQRPTANLKKINFNIAGTANRTHCRDAVKTGVAIASGVKIAKDLGNLPGNICTPTYLANQAKEIGRGNSKLKVSILDEKQMTILKMGSLLSVTRGSRQPAKLITLNYSGGKKSDKPVVLVGKGVTFDSGGVSIKPSPTMDEMKYDMCGAASVLGVLSTISKLKLPLNVVGVVPACENMPDGEASKPGDVVTSMSGQTIEVLNTDAEGRLILCDALTYSKRFKPAVVIDIATLTGACLVALGSHATAVIGNDDDLINELLTAGNNSNDRAWQLPLWEEYDTQLKSNFADMANIGGRDGGTITAACFLARFTQDYTWAHLDIAGTAWHSGARKGGTGRPVPLLTQYILDRCPD